MFRHGSDPIRSDTEAYTPSSGMDPTRLDPIPKLTHPLPAWIRSYPIRYRSLYPLFRNGSGPTRSDTGAYPSSTGMNPNLSDPVPELIHYLSVWNRSYPIPYRSLDIPYPKSSDPSRPDTGAYTSLSGINPTRYRRFGNLFRNGSDPLRSDTEAYTSSPDMDPILSDPIPELIPLTPEWIRPDPIRYRSLYILYWDESDPIRSGTGACTVSFGVEPILSDTTPELIHPLPPTALILSDPTPELIHPFTEGIRSDTEDLTTLSGMDPILSDPIPKLLHPLPAWIRTYRIRHRSLYPFFWNGSDHIRSDTGARASSTGMNPILSDPVPELIPYLAVWNRSDPIRHQSLYILYPNSSDPLRPDTGAYTSLSGMDPIRSSRFGNLFRNGSDPIRSDTEASTSSPGMDPILSDPIPELTPLLPESIRPDPIRYRSLSILCRD
jgi:hypothetical protein